MTAPGAPAGTLPEHEAKALAARYGIPTTAPVVLASRDDAERHAASVAGPQALKAVSPDLVHKRRAGAVLVGVPPSGVAAAFDAIVARCRDLGAELRGVLAEPMVPAGPELLAGFARDDRFGPVAVLGLGGSGVEVRRAVVRRLAPLTRADAGALVAAVQGGRLAAEVGADPAATEAALVDLLLALAGPGGMVDDPAIDAVDLNPVVLTESGPVAVDVRVATGGDRPPAPHRGADVTGLRALLAPRSVAVVGASPNAGSPGRAYLERLLGVGFPGAVHAVHPSADRVLDRPAHPSLAAVPEVPDLAVVLVAARHVRAALDDCARSGVGAAVVFAAGAGTGDDLAADVAAVTAASGLRVLGPNCLGVHRPAAALPLVASSGPPGPAGPTGAVAFVTQSGGFALSAVRAGRHVPLGFSAVVSAGNAADVSIADLVAWFDGDDATELVAVYAETMADPRSFLGAVAASRKPVVLLKGGRTGAGARAAATHTGGLALPDEVWEDACRQHGVRTVRTFDELLDACLTFGARRQRGAPLVRWAAPAPGEGRPGMALVGTGGGASVLASDLAVEHGFSVPPLGPAATRALAPFDRPGTSIANPVDVPTWAARGEDGRLLLGAAVAAVAADPGVAVTVVDLQLELVASVVPGPAAAEALAEEMVDAVVGATAAAPLALVLRTDGDPALQPLVTRLAARSFERGVPAFPTVERAVRAEANVAAAVAAAAARPDATAPTATAPNG